MEKAKSEVVVFDPTSRPKGETLRMAARPTELKGKTLGILWNGKSNGDVLLDRITQRLDERFHFSKILKEHKPDQAPMKTSLLDGRLASRLSSKSDFLINAVGD